MTMDLKKQRPSGLVWITVLFGSAKNRPMSYSEHGLGGSESGSTGCPVRPERGLAGSEGGPACSEGGPIGSEGGSTGSAEGLGGSEGGPASSDEEPAGSEDFLSSLKIC